MTNFLLGIFVGSVWTAFALGALSMIDSAVYHLSRMIGGY